MNSVVAKTWAAFLLKSASVIVGAFKKTSICPLRPPSEDPQSFVGACTAAMQCSDGKKATELELMSRKALGGIDVNQTVTSEPTLIFRAKKNPNRNLLIRQVAYDIVNRTLILPQQEMKRIVQEHAAARGIKIGSAIVTEASRMNPDSAMGLYSTDQLRAQARSVEVAKKKKKLMDAKSKQSNLIKQINQNKKKAAAYSRVSKSVKERPIGLLLRTALETHSPQQDLQLAYQHLGFKLSNLPNKKNGTFVALLADNDTIKSLQPVSLT
jgi:hypothetical protein